MSQHGRGLAFPPRVGPDGRLACSEGAENVRESIRVILGTGPGERLRRERFGAGLDRLLFEPNVTATHRRIAERIRRALAAWEPRIAVQEVDVAADPHDGEAAQVVISYALLATDDRERLTLSLRLGV